MNTESMNIKDILNESSELIERLKIFESKLNDFYTKKVEFNTEYPVKRDFKRFKRSFIKCSDNYRYFIYCLAESTIGKSE